VPLPDSCTAANESYSITSLAVALISAFVPALARWRASRARTSWSSTSQHGDFTHAVRFMRGFASRAVDACGVGYSWLPCATSMIIRAAR
jgi:hypothetical protein